MCFCYCLFYLVCFCVSSMCWLLECCGFVCCVMCVVGNCLRVCDVVVLMALRMLCVARYVWR